MPPRRTERNRLSTYEVKAVSHQNDSVPGGDTTPDEAQQNQGIVELLELCFWMNREAESINRCQLGFNLQQYVFHREGPASVSLSLLPEPCKCSYASCAQVVAKM